MGYGRDDSDPRERSRFDERERSSRFDIGRERSSRGSDSSNERGFFERAGDEISSWFGDDEAERRREMDERNSNSGRGDYRGYGRDEHRDQGRSPFFNSDERGQRYREDISSRPYSGRAPDRDERSGDMGRGMFGGRPDMQRQSNYRPLTGDYGRSSSEGFDRDTRDYGRAGAAVAAGASAAHDRHYSEWRQRQIDEIDRDYDDYRREHQSKFESDFSNWRSTRQSKRQMLGQIREHMDVCGSDEEVIGKVDKVRGDRIILTKSDSSDGQHHSINCSMIDRVEGDKVILDKKAQEAKAMFGNEDRDRALFERDDKREPGAHMLNRSFSGTY